MLADVVGQKARDSNRKRCFKANEDEALTNTRRCLFRSHAGGCLGLDGEWFMSRRRHLSGNAEALESLSVGFVKACHDGCDVCRRCCAHECTKSVSSFVGFFFFSAMRCDVKIVLF